MENSDVIVEVLLVLLMAGIVVSKLIDFLKGKEIFGQVLVPAGAAGRWNQTLSFLGAAVVFGLNYLGAGEKIVPAQEYALSLAVAIIGALVVMASAKITHEFINWVNGKMKYTPKG